MAAVLAFTATAANASAVGSTTENRAKAFNAAVSNAVGAGSHIAPGQGRGDAVPQQDLAQGRGVHTYYVTPTALDGATTGLAVLVHNAGPCRLRANPDAAGPHSTYRRDPVTGNITNYAEYRPQTNPMDPAQWELVKRVDLVGKPHYNKVTGEYVPTPHVQGPGIPGGVRPARPDEIP